MSITSIPIQLTIHQQSHKPIIISDPKPTFPSRKTSKKLPITNHYKHQIQTKKSSQILSFFKITKARSQQKQLKQQPYIKDSSINTHSKTHKKQEQFINKKLHNSWEEQFNDNSEIGSEYGDYNYDNQLLEVLKNKRQSPRQVYNTPKVIFRAATCQNEITQNKNKQYERFEKFKTQIHQHNYEKQKHQETGTNKKQIIIQDENLTKKPSYQTFTNFINYKHSNNKDMNIKHQLKKYVSGKVHTQPAEQNQQETNKQQQQKQVFGNFLNIVNKRIQQSKVQLVPLSNRKGQQQTRHRRSRTQHDQDNLINNNASIVDNVKSSQQIFQNYKKLKQAFRKVSSTYKQRLGCFKKKQSKKQQLQFNNHQHHHHHIYEKYEQQKIINLKQQFQQGQQQNNNIYFNNSIQKSKPSLIFQDIYSRQQFLTTRACLTPKNSSLSKINDVNIKKIIKDRQKDFFQQSNKKAQSPLFTFEQIKSRLAKIQQLQNTKRHNKSLTIINRSSRNQLLTKDLLIAINSKPYQQFQNTKSKVNKQKNNLSSKENPIKKHTDVYQRHMKRRMMMQNFSQALTPKISKSQHNN